MKDMINLKMINKTKYMLVFLYRVMKRYIYGYLVKAKILVLDIREIKLIPVLTIMKKSDIIAAKALLDIAVVDMLKYNQTVRFIINYVLWNNEKEQRFIVRIKHNGLNQLWSISQLYSSANWLEREVWDMYGLKFLFHTNLRRILTDYGFKGHVLRKEFPLVGYTDIYYDDAKQGIAINGIEISQTLRYYEFENPWNKWY